MAEVKYQRAVNGLFSNRTFKRIFRYLFFILVFLGLIEGLPLYIERGRSDEGELSLTQTYLTKRLSTSFIADLRKVSKILVSIYQSSWLEEEPLLSYSILGESFPLFTLVPFEVLEC